MPNAHRKRSDSGKQQTGREARRSTANARHSFRLNRHDYFDAGDGAPIKRGLVKILGDVRGEGFECGGRLRHIKQGCGKGCCCIECFAVPRRDGTPTGFTTETCACISCQRRRGARA